MIPAPGTISTIGTLFGNWLVASTTDTINLTQVTRVEISGAVVNLYSGSAVLITLTYASGADAQKGYELIQKTLANTQPLSDLTQTAPTITSITPNNGPIAGGTICDIVGIGFRPNSIITIDGTVVDFAFYVSDTLYTIQTPVGTVGAKDVVITDANVGIPTLTLVAAYTYT